MAKENRVKVFEEMIDERCRNKALIDGCPKANRNPQRFLKTVQKLGKDLKTVLLIGKDFCGLPVCTIG